MKEEKLTDNSLITFGMYKGTPLANIPDDYLKWFYETNIMKVQKGYNLQLMHYIKDNKETILK